MEQLLNIAKELCNLKHLYRNKLHKTCFTHDATYSDKKDLAKRTILDKILKDRAFETATSIHKILETNSSFYVKRHSTGKVQFLFFSSFC